MAGNPRGSSTARLVVIDGVTGKVMTAVDLAIDHVTDFRPVWADFKRPWYNSRREQRITSGRSTGSPWLKYSQTKERDRYQYIKASIVAKASGKSLRKMSSGDSAKLIASLKPLQWTPGNERLLPSLERDRHPDAIWRTKERSLTIGTSVPYAGSHDRGQGYAPEWAGGYRIPRRPLLRFGRAATIGLAGAVSTHAARTEQEFGRTTVGFSSDQVRGAMR